MSNPNEEKSLQEKGSNFFSMEKKPKKGVYRKSFYITQSFDFYSLYTFEANLNIYWAWFDLNHPRSL
jgi:hypothetical protein